MAVTVVTHRGADSSGRRNVDGSYVVTAAWKMAAGVLRVPITVSQSLTRQHRHRPPDPASPGPPPSLLTRSLQPRNGQYPTPNVASSATPSDERQDTNRAHSNRALKNQAPHMAPRAPDAISSSQVRTAPCFKNQRRPTLADMTAGSATSRADGGRRRHGRTEHDGYEWPWAIR
jgi:hypothetical protein